MHIQLSPGRMYYSDVKTKHWAYWETVQNKHVSWPFKVNCSHIWVMLPKETLWDFKVLLSLAGISPCPCHFPSIDLEPSEWRREKESWITTESKADGLIRAQQQLGSKLPLGGRTSGQEVPKRKPLAYPEASWSLKVREHIPEEHFIAQCSFKALEIYWGSLLCFLCRMLVWIS